MQIGTSTRRVAIIGGVRTPFARSHTAFAGTDHQELLTASLRMIAERPELQQLLRDERQRIPNFVEEMLRLETPIQGSFRLARRNTSVGGVDLAAGTGEDTWRIRFSLKVSGFRSNLAVKFWQTG